MKASIEVKDNVIIHRFEGDVYFENIIESWNEIFSRDEDFTAFKGIVTDFLDAKLHLDGKNMILLVDYLTANIDRLEGLKFAFVLDTHHVCNIMIIDRKIKQLQIRPFTTRDAAMSWINL